MRTIPIIATAASALLAGCGDRHPPAVTATPRNNAVCLALQPAMPVTYSAKNDTPETVKGVRAANARYQAACQF